MGAEPVSLLSMANAFLQILAQTRAAAGRPTGAEFALARPLRHLDLVTAHFRRKLHSILSARAAGRILST